MVRKSITKFVLRPTGDNAYNDTIDIDGKDFKLKNMITHEDGSLINRQAKVINVPIGTLTSAKVGDEVYIQHNTFRHQLGAIGNITMGKMIGDGNYFLNDKEVFAYNDGSEWKSTNSWIFLEPIKFIKGGAFTSHEVLRPDKGVIAFSQDPRWRDDTLEVNDLVTFREGKRVTSEIDGKTYFRIRQRDILLNHGKSSRDKIESYQRQL